FSRDWSSDVCSSDLATLDDKTAIVQVTVEGMNEPFAWSFRNHVESVLTKAGCNAGSCHGAAAGKNGFRLSLLGYDPEGDFQLIKIGRASCRERVYNT